MNRTIFFGLTAALATMTAALVTMTAAPALADGDPARGRQVLLNNCRPCHNVNEGSRTDMYGFNLSLFDLIGRPAASVDGFYYSDAMVDSGIVWDGEKLKAFIANPREYLEGTRMEFDGLVEAQDREDLAAFLESLAAGE